MSENTTQRGTPGFNPPPPLFIAPPVPIFRDEQHRFEYYVEEKRRWKEGYGGLTGAHYFYLTQCYLRDINGNIFKPEWRQVDQIVFEKVDSCMKRRKGLMVFKRRTVGLTSIFAGGLPFWFALTNPGILINMTSKDRDGFTRMFQDKVMTTFDNISEDILNRQALNKNNTKDQAFLKLAIKKIGSDGVTRIHDTTINLVETSENPKSVNKFSAGRAKFTFIDESALHARIADLLRSMEATQMLNADKEGFLCLGGTVEASLTNQQIADYQQLMEDVKAFDIETIFLACYQGLITKNGWDDVEAGKAWYYENVEKKKLSSNPADLRAFKMNFPIDEADVFQYARGGMFEEETVDAIKNRLQELGKEDNVEIRVKLIEGSNGIISVPDNSGNEEGFYLVEEPREGLFYYQVIDSIGAGTEVGAAEGSKIASTIYKGFDPDGRDYEPVCTYYERPATLEKGYNKIYLQFQYFNKFGGVKSINYETAAATADHLGTFLDKKGVYGKYAARRKDLSGKGWIDTKKRGVAVNDDTLDWMIRQANVFLVKYVKNFRSRLVLLQLLLPQSVNADVRSAFLVLMTSVPNFDKPVVKVKPPRTVTRIRLVNKNGYNVYETVVEKIDSEAEILEINSAEQYAQQLKAKYGENYWFNLANADEKQKYRDLKRVS